MQLDLTKFCEPDSIRGFGEPFNFGGYAYATDGAMLIRQPIDHQEASHTDSKMHPKVHTKAESWLANKEFKPIPDFALPESCACPLCNGSGHVTHCTACDGDGFDKHGTECEACHGNGIVPSGNTTDQNCWQCRGIGHIYVVPDVLFGHITLNAAYLELIKDLPGLQIALPDDIDNPAAFRFDGGEILLMPMRGKNPKTAEKRAA